MGVVAEVVQRAEEFLLEAPIWQVLVAGIVVFYTLLTFVTRARYVKSPDFYKHNKTKNLKMKLKSFPPPYPNGWIRVCSSKDLEGGVIKTISALGREFIAFRDDKGKVGVLDAYCPHLGAHLGKGGRIENGNVVCPFHEWAFDTNGKAQNIPYCRTEVPARAKTKAYHVHEHLEMVFIWFHAEEDMQEPQWELQYHKDCMGDNFYYVTSRQMEFDQHVIEMHMNSADYYHFQTLHRPLPFPILEKVLFGQHDLQARYFEKAIPEQPHVCFFRERMEKLFLFGKISIIPQFILRNIDVNVTFEGPCIVHFSVKTIFGEMRMIKTLLPIEPFKQYVEARWWAEKTVPRFLCYAMSIVAKKALEQDREVWENKLWKDTPMLVSGDGPFPAFKRYYMQFYSENSKSLAQNELEW